MKVAPYRLIFAGNPALPTKGSGIAIYNNNFTLAIKKLKFLASWFATTIRCRNTSISHQDTYNGKNGR